MTIMIHLRSDSFIIFSNAKNNDGAEVLYAPAYTADYGMKSVSGSLNENGVHITPKSDGTAWDIVCDFKSEGMFSFDAVLEENPPPDDDDAEHGDIRAFTAHVLVLGEDFPMLMDNFYQFAVGSKVEITGIRGECIQEFFDVSINPTGELLSFDGEKQYQSGLSVVAEIDTATSRTIGAKIVGTASRPGLYAFRVTTNSVTPQHETNPFPPGSATEMVMVSIYDPYRAGTLMVIDPYTEYEFNPDAFRVLTHALDSPVAEYLANSFYRNGDAFEWYCSVGVSAGSTIQNFDYLLYRIGDTWYIVGRSYFNGDAIPGYETLSTAPALANSEYPPSAGWSNGVIVMGAVKYFVSGYGFFDWKSETLYQSSPGWVRRYPGWDFDPDDPEGTDDPEESGGTGESGGTAPQGGVLMLFENGAFTIDGAEVEVVEISGAALPYSPPRIEDAALQELNFNGLVRIGDLGFAGGGAASGFWSRYPIHRQIHPVLNHPSVEMVMHVTDQYSHTISSTQSSASNFGSSATRSSDEYTLEENDEKTLKQSVNPMAENYSGDALSALYGVTVNGGSATHTGSRISHSVNSSSNRMGVDADWYTLTTQEDVSAATSISGDVESRAVGALGVGSGRNPGMKYEGAYWSGSMVSSARWPTQTTTTTESFNSGTGEHTTTTTTSNSTAGVGDALCSWVPALQTGDEIPISGGTVVVTEANFSGESSREFNDYSTPESLSIQMTATHSRTNYTGDGAPDDFGSTVVVFYQNGAEVSRTESDDPTGEVFSAAVAGWKPLEPPTEPATDQWVTAYTSKTEQYVQTHTASIGRYSEND